MKTSTALPVKLAGETIHLLPPGAAWWEREKTLLVADLHLGMSETFQAAGLGVPSAGHEQDLADLAELAGTTGAARLIVLGDFFHAAPGIPEDVLALVSSWQDDLGMPIGLALGSHDRVIRERTGELPFERVADLIEAGPFAFTHLPGDAPGAPAVGEKARVCGHLHPVVRLEGGRDRLRLRCFVLERRQLVLPAFGSMTGGAVVEGAKGRRRYPVTSDEVLDLGI